MLEKKTKFDYFVVVVGVLALLFAASIIGVSLSAALDAFVSFQCIFTRERLLRKINGIYLSIYAVCRQIFVYARRRAAR